MADLTLVLPIEAGLLSNDYGALSGDDFILRIGGREYGSYLDITTMTVQDSLEAHGDTANFRLVIPDTALATIGKPEGGNQVHFRVNGETQFTGVLMDVVPVRSSSPAVSYYECTCVDYTSWLDRKLIATTRPAEWAGDRIRGLISWVRSQIGDFSFTSHNVDRGAFVVPQEPVEEYDYVTFTSVLTALAESCSFQWYVDFNRDIHFYAERSLESPLSQDYGNILDVDTNLQIGSVTISEDVSQIKNRVYVRGYSQKGDSTYPDGPYWANENQSFYKIYQAPWDVEGTSVVVEGESSPRIVKLDPLDGTQESMIGKPGEAYLCIFNMGVRFPESDLPESGAPFYVYYNPELPDQITMFEDTHSIRFFARREDSSGIHEFVLSAPELRAESIDPIVAIGEYTLARWAWPTITGKLSTYEITGWLPGQSFQVHWASKDLYDYKTYEKTGKKVNLTVYVHKVKKTYKRVRDDDTGLTMTLTLSEVDFSNKAHI